MKTITNTKTYDKNGKLIKEETVEKYETKKPLNIHLLIDNSSSMNGSQAKVQSSVNEYIQTMQKTAKEDDADMRISVSLFTTGFYGRSYNLGMNLNLTSLRDNVKIQDVKPLSRNEINPSGGTPLYDAIGTTIRRLEAHTDCDTVLVILTDGEENQSTKFTAEEIRSLIKTKQACGWVVMYLGANQDAWVVGGVMGVAAGTTATYDMAFMQNAVGAAAEATARYSVTRCSASASYTSEELAGMTTKVNTDAN
jgi:uncharacterized protein YegL